MTRLINVLMIIFVVNDNMNLVTRLMILPIKLYVPERTRLSLSGDVHKNKIAFAFNINFRGNILT